MRCAPFLGAPIKATISRCFSPVIKPLTPDSMTLIALENRSLGRRGDESCAVHGTGIYSRPTRTPKRETWLNPTVCRRDILSSRRRNKYGSQDNEQRNRWDYGVGARGSGCAR